MAPLETEHVAVPAHGRLDVANSQGDVIDPLQLK
jgi:hypothetical protein